jgi:hypothetical protein
MNPARRWTDPEKHKLFKEYFDKDPGICPVCGRTVHMMMEQSAGVVTLTMRCDCGNRAQVTPPPEAQGL